MTNKKSKKKLVIIWQRLISGGATCPRCGFTEDELDKATLRLKEKLNPMGIEVILKKLEDLVGAETGQSQCCDVCGNKKCRTVKIEKESHETIPADMIVKAGLAAL